MLDERQMSNAKPLGCFQSLIGRLLINDDTDTTTTNGLVLFGSLFPFSLKKKGTTCMASIMLLVKRRSARFTFSLFFFFFFLMIARCMNSHDWRIDWFEIAGRQRKRSEIARVLYTYIHIARFDMHISVTAPHRRIIPSRGIERGATRRWAVTYIRIFHVGFTVM